MLAAGEDPLFIARRLIILASEDIGNANPTGLVLATAGAEAVHQIGMPEARIVLAQVTTYLASSPKSNAAYKAITDALEAVEKETFPAAVPLHLRNPVTGLLKREGYGKGYVYPHDSSRPLCGRRASAVRVPGPHFLRTDGPWPRSRNPGAPPEMVEEAPQRTLTEDAHERGAWLWVLLLLPVIGIAGQWEWQRPGPQGDLLWSVDYASATDLWAVGWYGAAVHSTDGGASWANVAALPDSLWYYDLQFVTPDEGWICGTAGLLLHTTDAGGNWLPQASGVGVNLRNLSFPNADNGWVCGSGGTHPAHHRWRRDVGRSRRAAWTALFTTSSF